MILTLKLNEKQIIDILIEHLKQSKIILLGKDIKFIEDTDHLTSVKSEDTNGYVFTETIFKVDIDVPG